MSEPTPIHELMDRDPLSLSDADLDAIVAELRKKRAQFNAGNIKAGNTKAPTAAQKKKAESVKAVLGTASLSDLGL